MYIRLVLDYLAISLPFGSYIKPPPHTCCFPIWSLGYGSFLPVYLAQYTGTFTISLCNQEEVSWEMEQIWMTKKENCNLL